MLFFIDQCVSTALPWPNTPGATPPIPALPGPARPGPILPGQILPWPALPWPTPPGTTLPGPGLPALPGQELPRPVVSKPALNGVEMGQSSSTAFSFTDSQSPKAMVLDEKQNETGITSAGKWFAGVQFVEISLL